MFLGLAIAAVAVFLAHVGTKAPASTSAPKVKPAPVVKPKPKSTGCAAADAYVAGLKKIGLPTPSNWDSLSCEQKVALVGTAIGGGSIIGMAEGAVAAVAGDKAGEAVKSVAKKLGF